MESDNPSDMIPTDDLASSERSISVDDLSEEFSADRFGTMRKALSLLHNAESRQNQARAHELRAFILEHEEFLSEDQIARLAGL